MTTTTNPAQFAGESAIVGIHLIETAAQIRSEGTPGFDRDSLEELAASIKVHGLLQPLVVERIGLDSYRLIAGERRLLACSMIDMDTVPVMIRPEGDPDMRRAAQAVENLQRVDLTMADRATGVQILAKAHGTKGAARLLGKSSAWVSNQVRYFKLPEDVRAAGVEGQCEDLDLLASLAKLKGTPHYPIALEELARSALSRETVRRLVQQMEAAKKPAQATGDQGEGDGQDEAADKGSTQPQADKLGKLPLSQAAAVMMVHALEAASKHEKTAKSRELYAGLNAWLRDWVNNTWGV